MTDHLQGDVHKDVLGDPERELKDGMSRGPLAQPPARGGKDAAHVVGHALVVEDQASMRLTPRSAMVWLGALISCASGVVLIDQPAAGGWLGR